MKTFKQFLEDLFESKHEPESEEHRSELLGLDHSQVDSKNRDHKYFHDKIHAAIKGLNSATHGEEAVRDHLHKWGDSPNRWVQMAVARHPELHNYPELAEKLKNSKHDSIVVAASAERKAAKASTPASKPAPEAKKEAPASTPAKKKPAPEAKKEAPASAPAPKAAKAKAKPAPASEPSSDEGYANVSGETGDVVRRRTHVTHGGKHIGTVETNKNGTSRVLTSHGGMIATTKVPDHDEGIATIKDWHADKSLDSVDSPIRHKK